MADLDHTALGIHRDHVQQGRQGDTRSSATLKDLSAAQAAVLLCHGVVTSLL
jgi:hypothetical protein